MWQQFTSGNKDLKKTDGEKGEKQPKLKRQNQKKFNVKKKKPKKVVESSSDSFRSDEDFKEIEEEYDNDTEKVNHRSPRGNTMDLAI